MIEHNPEFIDKVMGLMLSSSVTLRITLDQQDSTVQIYHKDRLLRQLDLPLFLSATPHEILKIAGIEPRGALK